MAIGAVLAISGLGAGVIVGLLGGLALAGAGGAAIALTVKHGAAVRRRRVRGGAEGLIGQIGVVRSWTEPTGSVSLHGAVWQRASVPGRRRGLRARAATAATESWSNG